jgi:superfamily II DNA or RNA helicase
VAGLEDLTPGARVRGLIPDRTVEVVQAVWHGTQAVSLTYRDRDGRLGEQLVYRDDEPRLEIERSGAAFAFDANGALFRLVSEALRIRLAYLFDPLLAVHTSVLEPLPHQITAVYGELLPRQPLRFLLADDPGAGKTIMAGLFIKELIVRGDLKRCLVICPGSLVEQWQDELWDKFGLHFEIVTRETIENSRSGNPFAEKNLVLARLDHLARNDDIVAKLQQTDWDLVVADEAHKMSAHYFGGEVKETKRYKLGKVIGSLTRHLLLMTATPHAGKEADFQLFMALLDGDRFEGRFRDGVHTTDTRDLMRRMVKEELLRFDGRRLFPERRAYSVEYTLSDEEAYLYKEVTDYVRDEMNRAERLKSEGEGRRGAVVGFALTVLQRRLASSPEAIYQSLKRRRKRLEDRLREEQFRRRGAEAKAELAWKLTDLDEEDVETIDEGPDAEVEELEEEIVDEASAAQTIEELKAEISTLARLEELARKVRNSGTDRKWEELSNLLQHQREMFDAEGARRKLIIFTEHRDTMNYLADRIRTLLGRPEAVVTIHGGMGREERRKTQEAFTQDKDVLILVATDAAGEGINLQRAHLMVNYDLPWNPNRIEQRFGRIHRIGQEEVCHMWNLVAVETREGEVFKRLFDKLETQRQALGGRVFDVLGRVFTERSLRDLLIEAVRYGERPEVKAKLQEVVDRTVGEELRRAVTEQALVTDVMSAADVERIREQMEEAEARRLQPHFIRSFFLEAFTHLGGRISEREPGRYEITHVPADVRARDRVIGVGIPVLRRYERVTFDKELVNVHGRPMAEFVAPGHPLLDSTVDLILERYRDLLKRGTVLVAEADPSEAPRVLLYLQHAIQDARLTPSGDRRVVSTHLQFVELLEDDGARDAGYAPYLDYRPLQDDEWELVRPVLSQPWLGSDVERRGTDHAIRELVPRHLEDVRRQTIARVERTIAAVKDRLTKEINYWDHRATELKRQELAGKQPKMNSAKARQRADELQARLKRRLEELEQEKQLSPLPPVVIGGAVVVPQGLLERLRGARSADPSVHARMTERVERLAIEAVMATERHLGREPVEMPRNNPGFDIRSKDPRTSDIYFIEVKGRIEGADVVTVTRNEILTALNKPDRFILALVEVGEDEATQVRYLQHPFAGTKDAYFAVTSVNYEWDTYFERAEVPA